MTESLESILDSRSDAFRFVDLFSGLGGFHLAMSRLGGTCVMACEIDEGLRELYSRNFGITPEQDIRVVDPLLVPDHDALCAGFPCQSFSKAGSQLGLACLENGDLIHHVIAIVKEKSPRYLLLENVPNLAKHDDGHTWKLIRDALEGTGYAVDYRILSPHHFGIPQIRERMFIVGCRGGLDQFTWPNERSAKSSIRSVLDSSVPEARRLSGDLTRCLDVWQEFLDRYPSDEELPSFPIWSMEFGATYPYEGEPPSSMSVAELKGFMGSHGQPLQGQTKDDLLSQLPSYARGDDKFPQWKKTFIKQNRELYEKNKVWIEDWKASILEFAPSFQKFEWNCKGEKRVLWEHVLQVRASGIRVKRDTTAPSLIAMTTTQVPIIGWQRRYMTPRECARLQSMPEDLELPSAPTRAYKALGNTVNQDIVHKVASSLLRTPASSPAGHA